MFPSSSHIPNDLSAFELAVAALVCPTWAAIAHCPKKYHIAAVFPILAILAPIDENPFAIVLPRSAPVSASIKLPPE